MKRAKESPNRQAKEHNLAVALPGELYEQAGQWWWRTALPGEDKAKARPLKAPGAGETAGDRAAAEKAAIEMWGQAVTQRGARQITLDCTQKVERLKAQFLDKVRQLTEIVESANAKAQAEAKARAEIEARLNAMIQAAPQEAMPAAQTQPPVAPRPGEPAAALVGEEHMECAAHADNPQASGAACPTTNDASIARQTPVLPPETICPLHPAPEPVAIEEHDLVAQTGVCECCGAPDVPVSDLLAIDSGQLLCPDCIEALHIDISRIEAKTLSNSHA
ncbi:MAG: hypothetical protein ABFE01_19555 [Phycisphaerales bacterium]